MARQVKVDCPILPVPFTYTGNSIYHRGPPRTRRGPRRICGGGGSAAIAGGLRTILRGVERAGEKKPRLYCQQGNGVTKLPFLGENENRMPSSFTQYLNI